MKIRMYSQKCRLILIILPLLLISCNQGNSKSKASVIHKAKMHAAINIGYYLGQLAGTYAPWIRDSSNTQMARENFSMLIQSDIDFLNGTLTPSPMKLAKLGRGKNQFDKIPSYFSQITKVAEKENKCIKPVIGMSLASGGLVINTFEAESLFMRQNIEPSVIKKFKDHFISRLSMFSTLAGTCSILCEDNQYPEMLLIMFRAMQEDSWKWRDRIQSSNNQTILKELRKFRLELDQWINNAMRLVGPNTK